VLLVQAFNWSLYDLDNTDIESLIPFLERLTRGNKAGGQGERAYCDEVSWL
jgi:hypothetical protein